MHTHGHWSTAAHLILHLNNFDIHIYGQQRTYDTLTTKTVCHSPVKFTQIVDNL